MRTPLLHGMAYHKPPTSASGGAEALAWAALMAKEPQEREAGLRNLAEKASPRGPTRQADAATVALFAGWRVKRRHEQPQPRDPSRNVEPPALPGPRPWGGVGGRASSALCARRQSVVR